MKKIFVVAAIFIGSQSYAQDSTRTLEGVTLTAFKYSIKTTQTGKVVTVITRQDIEHAGSRDLSQVISEFGGSFINGYTSNLGKEKNVYVRGARPEHTLITIDGVPVYDASGIGSYFDLRNINIDNVERIEILKGSQSTLYGSDAIAGVINIITKKGGNVNGKPQVNGVINYGSYNTLRSGINLNGTHRWLDYNIGLAHGSSDGISEASSPGTITFEKDHYKQNSLNANFTIRAHDRLSLQPFFRYSRFTGDIDLDALRDEKDFSNNNDNIQAGIRNILRLGKGQLNALYQFIRTERFYLDDSLYVDPNAYYFYNRQNYVANEHFAEAFLVYPFGKMKLTAGVDGRWSNTDYNAYQINVFSPMPETPSFSGDSVKQNQLGVYAALNLTHGIFNVEGGGRFNNHSEYGSNFAFNFNPSVLIQQRLKVFANVSSGYKTPSLYQLFSVYGNKDLDPEVSLNLEGGVQYYFKDQKSNIRFTYFKRDVEDVIAFFYDPNTFQSRYINQDKQKDYGFEADAVYSLGNKLQLRAQYSYVTGKVTTQQAGKDTSYFNLLRRPKSSFNFIAGLQATRDLYCSAQLSAVGERKDVFFDPVTFDQVDISLKSYLLLNLHLEYRFRNSSVKIFTDVRNVLDENYMDIYGYGTLGINAHGGIRFSL